MNTEVFSFAHVDEEIKIQAIVFVVHFLRRTRRLPLPEGQQD